MFAIKSSVLTAALLGHNAFAVDAAACYPAYVNGGTYSSGAQVSASTTTETTENTNCSPPGTSTCPDSGIRTTTTTTTKTSNYQCVDNTYSSFCGNSAFAPGNAATASGASLTWTLLGECSGTASVPAPTPPPTPALWSGGGCPKAYALGTDYSAGDVVTVAGAAFSLVYQCKESPSDLWCPMTGYEPGSSQAWEQAWTEIGSCVGTIAPTTSPVYVTIPDAGGCPAAFSAGEAYEEGDKVAVDGLVYQCKGFPQGLHCSQDGYEPGSCLSDDVCYWKEAWTVAGYCEGTIAPTTSPNYVTLQDLGGCPDEWAPQTYEEGDRVSDGSLVYECKAWPFSGHCGQAGYEPNVSPAAPDAWKQAWTVLGHCSGSIAPTTSPNFDRLAVDIEGCPEPWNAGKSDYEAGDLVAYRVSENPQRDVVFKCKDWPESGFCNQGTGFEPTSTYGNMAWDLHGACSGTTAPTTSPFAYTDYCRYDRCRDEDRTETSCTPGRAGCSCLSGQDPGPTCTRDYTEEVCVEMSVDPWTEGTDYQTGDVVRAGVERFKCRPWPNGLWCGIAAYRPVADDSMGSSLWRMAWLTDGTCGECGEIVPEDSDIRVKVTLVDDLAVNVNNTAYGSYNMRVVEQMPGGNVAFVDQKDAIVWLYDGTSPRVFYDASTDGFPIGISPETNRPTLAFNAAQKTQIHTVAMGSTGTTMIVVFTSTTIPSNYAGTPLALPDNQEFKLWSEGDCDGLADFDSVCRNFGNIFPAGYGCCTSQQVYKVFYEFDIDINGLLDINTTAPFFAYEIQQTYGHDGGGSIMTDGGKLLWGVGDCLPFGYSGLSATQDMNSHCGKMLLIDPSAVGSYQIVAKGVRNSQQMFLLPNDNVLWMDIGGVTAEEVNQVPLSDLLDTSEIENFGWGIRAGENFAREGSFKVDEGSRFGSFGVEPACIDEQSAAEQVGFLLPYMEFANPKSAGGAFYGISGVVASTISFTTIKVAASLFNEVVDGESVSRLVVGTEDFTKNSPIQAYHASLWQEESGELVEMTRGFNDLVRDLQLNDPISAGDFFPGRTPWRGDARLFQLPDGSAGVLIERLGKFYKLEEL